MRGAIKIKIFSTLDNIVRHNAASERVRGGRVSKGKRQPGRKANKKKEFLIIHKNLDEFVTFRHLPSIKNKVTTAEMVMDELKGEKLEKRVNKVDKRCEEKK